MDISVIVWFIGCIIGTLLGIIDAYCELKKGQTIGDLFENEIVWKYTFLALFWPIIATIFCIWYPFSLIGKIKIK